jgi:hypothetical protein
VASAACCLGTYLFIIARGRGVAGQRGAGKLASSNVVARFHIEIEGLTAAACPGRSGTEHCYHRDYIS